MGIVLQLKRFAVLFINIFSLKNDVSYSFYFSSDNGTSRLNSNMPPLLPAADAIISEDRETSKVTTVLLQPENCCRVRTANHVTYSIDTKPKHTVRGSPL